MAKGDHVAVQRRFYVHHGIDIGEGCVIHFTDRERGMLKGEIRIDSLSAFADGSRIRIVEYAPAFDAEAVVARAWSRLREKRYDLVFRNCEHFATWCKTGDATSAQVKTAVKVVAGALGALAGVPLGPLGAGTGAALGSSIAEAMVGPVQEGTSKPSGGRLSRASEADTLAPRPESSD